MEDKKKLTIALVAGLIVIATALLIIFGIKGSEEAESKNPKTNYTLVFNETNEGKKIQSLSFIYKKSKLEDITLTLYYDNAEVAEELVELYKEENEFKDVTQNKEKVILHYSDNELNKYIRYSKEELIEMLEGQGYVYQDKTQSKKSAAK